MTPLHPSWGFDLYGPIPRALMPRILASGVGFVGGYVFAGNKGMTPESVQMLSEAGLRILSYYEGRSGDKLAGFSAEQGKRDAADCLKLAQKLGQPAGSSIFFAVDLDESATDAAAHVIPHFQALHREIGDAYQIDGYGSGLTLRLLTDGGLIIHSVLGAIGWGEGHAFLPRATVVQKPPSDPYGYGVLVDPLFSQQPTITPFTWSTGAPIQPATPHPANQADLYSRPLQLGARGDDVRVLQGMLGVAVDGIWGRATEAAAVAYRKDHGLAPGTPLRLEMVGG